MDSPEIKTSLLASLKIKPDEAAAFGDNYNDLEMLSFVGSGFVMENAAPEIYCRYIFWQDVGGGFPGN